MDLEITCKAIDSAVAYGSSGDITVMLNNVSESVIEQFEESDIASYGDTNKILEAMDCDDIIEFLEWKYDVKVMDLSKDVV